MTGGGFRTLTRIVLILSTIVSGLTLGFSPALIYATNFGTHNPVCAPVLGCASIAFVFAAPVLLIAAWVDHKRQADRIAIWCGAVPLLFPAAFVITALAF